jgi:pimeloyl-ACP methyl ester carboxylesterase
VISDARLHVVPGGGHLVLLDSPELSAPVITSFLREEPAAPVG